MHTRAEKADASIETGLTAYIALRLRRVVENRQDVPDILYKACQGEEPPNLTPAEWSLLEEYELAHTNMEGKLTLQEGARELVLATFYWNRYFRRWFLKGPPPGFPHGDLVAEIFRKRKL